MNAILDFIDMTWPALLVVGATLVVWFAALAGINMVIHRRQHGGR